MKDLDNLQQNTEEETDYNTGAAAKPLPKSRRGRPPGSKNKFSASSREVLEKFGPAVAEAICKFALGKPITRVNAKGQREKISPNIDQMQTSQKMVVERLVAAVKATELTGKDGEALIPHTEDPNPRQLARAILAIFSEASLEAAENAPPPPPQGQKLLTRSEVIEINPKDSDAPVSDSAPATALEDEAPGATISGSPGASPTPSPPRHGDRIEIATNGGHLYWDESRRRWGVFDSLNRLHGWKHDKQQALNHAENVPRYESAPQRHPFEAAKPDELYAEMRRDSRPPLPGREPRVLRRSP